MHIEPAILQNLAALVDYEPHRFAQFHSGGEFRIYRHTKYLGEIIADTVHRGDGRLVINMPPQVGKSELVSRWLPPWYLKNYPKHHIMICSYASDLACADFGRVCRNRCRDIATFPEYMRPASDGNSMALWDNMAGGRMVTSGVGGSVTGKGGNFIGFDDPHKNWQEAWSSAKRRAAWEFFQGSLRTRLRPHGTIIVTQTRWHFADVSGHIERGEAGPDWKIIRLPMLAEKGDPLGRREGEPLCPEIYDERACEDIRRSVGESVWQAVYQQRPDLSLGGRVYTNFKESMVREVAPSKTLPLCLCLDFNINPGMHAEVVQYDQTSDLFNIIDEIYRPRMNLIECLREFCQRSRQIVHNGEIQVFGDPTGTAEAIRDSYSQYVIVTNTCHAEGIKPRLRIASKHPRRIDMLNAMQDALCDVRGREHVVISPRCKRLITDFREVQKDEGGLPDKSDSELTHASDAFNYMVEYLRPVGGPIRLPIAGRVLV